MTGPWKQPSSLSDTLEDLLKKKQYGKRIKQHQLLENWAELVGSSLAKKTKPLKISQNTLWIGVEHSSWIQELQFLKGPLLNKLHENHFENNIKKIRFVLDE